MRMMKESNQIKITLSDGMWSCTDGTWLKFKTPLREYLSRVFWKPDNLFEINNITYTEKSFISHLNKEQTSCAFETDESIPADQAAYRIAPPAEINDSDGFLLLNRAADGWCWRIADDGCVVYNKGTIANSGLSLTTARDQILKTLDMLNWVLYPKPYAFVDEMVLDDYY